MQISQLISQPFMHSDIVKDFSDRHFVQAMLDFELAIIKAREDSNLIPKGISRHTRQALSLASFDIDAVATNTYLGGNPAIPFVAQAKNLLPTNLKSYFHQTVTSQDVVDTAMMMMLKPAFERICHDLIEAIHACHTLIATHQATPMSGRTLMQHALPITFGVKVSQWAAALIAIIPSMVNLTQCGFYLQWGGPVGVSDEENERYNLPDYVADILGLDTPLLPWHTNRQPIHALTSTLDGCAGAMENIVIDIALMSQSELGEVSEPIIAGMGGSSSMPHKRNPVLCALIKTATLRMHGQLSIVSNTTAQPFERALGQWHATWMPLMEGTALVAGAAQHLKTLLQGLQVNPARMSANLDLNSDAYLIKPLQRYFSAHSIPYGDIIDRASTAAHSQHKGFVDTFVAGLNEEELLLPIMNDSAFKQILSPLSYCGAANRQCTTTMNAIEDLVHNFKKEA